MTEKIGDEMLMAFVDGELELEAADKLRRAILGDSSLERRAEAFRTSRALAREAFAAVTAEPVPGRLVAAVMTRDADRDAVARRPGFLASAMPLAAAVAIAAGLGGYLLGQAGAPGEAPMLGGPALAEAVGSAQSGERRMVMIGDQEISVTVLASYAVEGGLCRSFEARPATADMVRGIGCSFGEAWHVDIAVALPDGGGFAPASSGAAASLDAYLDVLGAQGPLDQEDEALRQ